tara:strand:- start:2663 stop:3523 length:861 start_codon:yes stop_codon:yes gene_type:complete
MGKTIILTTANIQEGTSNTRLVYNFPSGGYTFKNDVITLQSLYQYFSIFNITSSYANNTFTYKWFDGTTYTITIPDGYYEISDINAYIQSVMIASTHYMTNSAGQYVYFLEFVVNVSRYAVQINLYPLSTAIQTLNSYSLPAGATWSVPSSATQVEVNITTTAFGEVLGYAVGTYGNSTYVAGTTPISFLSSEAPQITPYSSIVVSCSLVNNKAIIPSNILASFTPLGTSIGSLFKYEPNMPQYADIDDGQYTQLTIEFRDQLSRQIIIQDPNMLISLYTEKKNIV